MKERLLEFGCFWRWDGLQKRVEANDFMGEQLDGWRARNRDSEIAVKALCDCPFGGACEPSATFRKAECPEIAGMVGFCSNHERSDVHCISQGAAVVVDLHFVPKGARGKKESDAQSKSNSYCEGRPFIPIKHFSFLESDISALIDSLIRKQNVSYFQKMHAGGNISI